MQLQQMFDVRSVEPSSVFQPLPAGEYKVMIVDSQPEATTKGGGMLVLTLKVQEGQYAGRDLRYNLNLWNTNQQAVEIAYRQLSALGHVTGVFQINATENLHGIPFIAVVAIQKDNPQYNDIKGVKDLNGNVPGKGGNAGVASAQPPAAAPAPAAPWGAPAVQPAPAAPAPWAGAQPAAPTAPWGAPPQAAPAPAAAPPAAATPPWGAPQAPAATPPWGAPPTAAPAPAAPPAGSPPWAQGAPPAPPTWGK